jgi:hypothetical protein
MIMPEQSVVGTVIGFSKLKRHGRRRGHTQSAPQPVITFDHPDGGKRAFIAQLIKPPLPVKVGDTVQVLIHPKDPKRVRAWPLAGAGVMEPMVPQGLTAFFLGGLMYADADDVDALGPLIDAGGKNGEQEFAEYKARKDRLRRIYQRAVLLIIAAQGLYWVYLQFVTTRI